MNVATYNIASGGFDGYGSSASEPERLPLLQEAINILGADIVGLTDTFRWADIFTDEQVQATLNYPHSFHIDMHDARVDKRIGVALLSRYPILTSHAVRLHTRNAIQATIQVSESESLEVFVVYLDDLSETIRQKQAQALTRLLPNDGPVVVMGDFNAIWPQQVPVVKKHVEGFLEKHPEFTEKSDYSILQATFANFYKATVMSSLAEQGLVESPELRPTALTPLHALGLPTIFPVDHIVTKNCVASDYVVRNEDLLDRASDHYPLMATIDI